MTLDRRRRLLLRGALRDAREAPAPMRPPWSLADDETFTRRCTRCGDCARACPHGLIGAGDGGYPVLSFARRGCDLCGACLRACGSGALDACVQPALRSRVRIEATCLTLRGVECRVCGDACAAAALRFDPAPGGIARVHADTAACTGCGDCVAVCPVGAIAMAAA